MNILFMIEVQKSVLIKTPSLMFDYEPTMIFELVVRSFFNTCPFSIRFGNPTKPHTTQI